MLKFGRKYLTIIYGYLLLFSYIITIFNSNNYRGRWGMTGTLTLIYDYIEN